MVYAKTRIIKVPLVNGLNTTKGVELAPDAIMEQMKTIYSNESGVAIDAASLAVEEFSFSEDLVEANDAMYEQVFKKYGKEERLLFLGGDHSVSYALTRSFMDYCNHIKRKPALIIFDAHPDLMEPVDQSIPTHEEWVSALINQGFDPKRILFVGLRNSDPQELDVIQSLGIKVFSMHDFLLDLEGKTDAIMEFGYGCDVYVSIDIDVVDPAFAPGVGYSEPGGFASRQFLYIVQRLKLMKHLRAIDLVEVNPKKDVNAMTSKLGAKIVAELL